MRSDNLSLYIKKLLDETKITSDNECLELSKNGEISYILNGIDRISYVIGYLRFLFDQNLSNKNAKLLDIGTSPFTFLFKDYFDMDTSSIDRTDLFQKRCKFRYIRFRICDLNKEKILFDEDEFDICIFTEVFEHLTAKPDTLFKEIKRTLKNEGFLIFSTPNLATLINRIRLLIGKPIFCRVDEVLKDCVHGYGHVRTYTMSEIIDLLSKFQFNIIKHNHICCYRGERRGKRLYRMAQRIVTSFREHNLVLARNKK